MPSAKERLAFRLELHERPLGAGAAPVGLANEGCPFGKADFGLSCANHVIDPRIAGPPLLAAASAASRAFGLCRAHGRLSGKWLAADGGGRDGRPRCAAGDQLRRALFDRARAKPSRRRRPFKLHLRPLCRPCRHEFGRRQACVQVDFTPLGAYRFFGLPMRELSGSMVSLDDLADNEIAELRRKLEDTETGTRGSIWPRLRARPPSAGSRAQPRGGLGLSRTRLLPRQRPHRDDRRQARLEPQASVAAFPGRDRPVAEIAGPHAALQPGARSCQRLASPTGPGSPPNAAMPTRRI